jgi:xanthine dehydrogenase/oxidase
MPGVVSYVDYKDIPGRNSAIQDEGFNEELFSSGKVNYAGQAIGLIVANTFEEAHSAARFNYRQFS